MREYPVFVPSDDEVFSAVVAVPRGEPRALVLLLPGGGGAPRSHRGAIYTKIARGLADRGIASVRMDWKGIGDSTGQARYSFNTLPVADAIRVARFAMEATGARVFGMAGNCGGARAVLATLPRIPEATTGVLMMLKPLTGTRSRTTAVRKTKLFVRRIPRLGPMARRAYWALRWRQANPVLDQVRAVSAHVDLLLLEANTVKVGKLPRLIESLQRKNGKHRLELREMPGGATRAFQSLERQNFVVKSVIEWFDQAFPGGSVPADGPLVQQRQHATS